MEKRLNFNVLTSDDSDDTSTSDYAFKINVNTNGLKLIEKGNESSGEEEFFFQDTIVILARQWRICTVTQRIVSVLSNNMCVSYVTR